MKACESKIVPDQTVLRVKQSDELFVVIFIELFLSTRWISLNN